MALTDNPNTKKETRIKAKNKNLAAGNTRYSDKQKVEAVTMWLSLGNLAMTSRMLNIPEITLRVWKASEWWKQVVEDIKLQEKVEVSSRMKRIIEASQLVVAQRLETGDPYVDAKGNVYFKPVNMRDAHRVAVDTLNQRAVLEKAVNADTPDEAKDDDKLAKLAEKFAQMATMSIEKNMDKRRTVEMVDDVQDVEVVEAHENVQSLSPGETSD